MKVFFLVLSCMLLVSVSEAQVECQGVCTETSETGYIGVFGSETYHQKVNECYRSGGLIKSACNTGSSFYCYTFKSNQKTVKAVGVNSEDATNQLYLQCLPKTSEAGECTTPKSARYLNQVQCVN